MNSKGLLYPQPTSGTLMLYYYCDFLAQNNADENDLTAVADLVIYLR